jgi:hypothetical protein
MTESTNLKQIEYFKDSKQNRKDKFSSIILILFSSLALVNGYNIISLLIIGAMGLAVGLFLAKSSFSKKPAVLVNKYGIKTNVNGIGLVPWIEIEDFEIVEGPNTEFIKVIINDNNTLLSRKNRLTKILMKSNVKRLGSIVVIPKQEFDKPLIEVLTELKNAYAIFINS